MSAVRERALRFGVCDRNAANDRLRRVAGALVAAPGLSNFASLGSAFLIFGIALVNLKAR